MSIDQEKAALQNVQSDLNDRPEPTPITPEYEGQLARDSYYYTGFWGSYKGYVKGLLGGAFVGGGLGAAIGLACSSVLVGVSLVAPITTPLALIVGAGITTLSTAWGMKKGSEEFAHIGSVAGTGVMLDEFEMRNDRMQDALHRRTVRTMAKLLGREDELKTVMPEAFEPVKSLAKAHVMPEDGPHMAAATMPTTGLFHWKTAAIGLVVGAAVGGLLVASVFALPALGGIPLIAGAAHSLAAMFGLEAGIAVSHATMAMAYASVMTATGLFGGIFAGLDRSIFRKTFDVTDHWFSGQLRSMKHAEAMNPELTQNHTPAPSVPVFAAASVAPGSASISSEAAASMPAAAVSESYADRLRMASDRQQALSRERAGASWQSRALASEPALAAQPAR